MKKDRKYWHDKYAPQKHSKGYWKARYNNTVLHDQQYYLDKYVNSQDEENDDEYTWDNFRSGEQIIFLIALFLYIVFKFK